MAAEKLITLRQGVNPKHRAALNPTLRSWLNRYLEHRTDLRPGSVRTYRTVERTLAPWMDLELHQISGDMVETMHKRLAAIIGVKKNRYTGEATANFAMKVLRATWNFASDRVPDLPPNPVRRLKRGMFPEPRRTRYVSAEQLPVFYSAVQKLDNPIVRDFILLLLFTGLRRGEAASLRWVDIDFTERVIRLPATATKAKRALDLPMSDFVADLLVARRALGNAQYVFPGRIGGRHLSANVNAWADIAALCGITVSAHDMRRTYATVAGNTEIAPFALKALLNHSVGSDVTAGYIVSMPTLKEAGQKVCDRMKMLCSVNVVSGDNVKRLGERK